MKEGQREDEQEEEEGNKTINHCVFTPRTINTPGETLISELTG